MFICRKLCMQGRLYECTNLYSLSLFLVFFRLKLECYTKCQMETLSTCYKLILTSHCWNMSSQIHHFASNEARSKVTESCQEGQLWAQLWKHCSHQGNTVYNVNSVFPLLYLNSDYNCYTLSPNWECCVHTNLYFLGWLHDFKYTDNQNYCIWRFLLLMYIHNDLF